MQEGQAGCMGGGGGGAAAQLPVGFGIWVCRRQCHWRPSLNLLDAL
jgi:hypothetical protein